MESQENLQIAKVFIIYLVVQERIVKTYIGVPCRQIPIQSKQ